MEIDTNKLYEFRVRGKEIILQYCTEDDARVAYNKVHKEIMKNVKLPEF